MEITKVWLKTEEKNSIVVLVEVNGKWYKIIDECCGVEESEISHCVHVEHILPSNALEVAI